MTYFTTTIGTAAINDSLKNLGLQNSGGDLMASILVLGKGMLGIFLFMLVFYLLIYGLEKLFTEKPGNEV
ncbi:MAG TPA: hypothetical protein PLX59_04485 [Candidatus Cloacimonadota bacterium]|nr:hypothetical protein [Candidatus Cloacimonadota bacterium]